MVKDEGTPPPSPEEILAALLAISPKDAAEVRDEADVKADPTHPKNA
jgi:hypothetical protein